MARLAQPLTFIIFRVTSLTCSAHQARYDHCQVVRINWLGHVQLKDCVEGAAAIFLMDERRERYGWEVASRMASPTHVYPRFSRVEPQALVASERRNSRASSCDAREGCFMQRTLRAPTHRTPGLTS